MQIDIGISAEDRQRVAEGMTRVLADTFALYVKTHAFHWNVTGPMFHTLHEMFEEQYQELWEAIDEIAERIRSLGHSAPANGAAMLGMAAVKEQNGIPEAAEMVRQLTLGHEQCARTIRAVLPATDKGGDDASQDLLIERLRAHEKTAWMLRSQLPEAG